MPDVFAAGSQMCRLQLAELALFIQSLPWKISGMSRPALAGDDRSAHN
jgi:hypothetical protein